MLYVIKLRRKHLSSEAAEGGVVGAGLEIVEVEA